MRHYDSGLPIRTRIQGDGRPIAFVLSGVTHRVETVEDLREPRLDWWAPGGEIHRVYWLVTTHLGLVCEIYRDVPSGEWFMGRRYD